MHGTAVICSFRMRYEGVDTNGGIGGAPNARGERKILSYAKHHGGLLICRACRMIRDGYWHFSSRRDSHY
jgi:hypothetical protein